MGVLFNRPTQIVVVLFFVLIAFANGIQVWLSARGQAYVGEIRSTLESVSATQRVGLKLMRMLSYDLSEEWPLDVDELEGVTADLATEVAGFSRHADRENLAKLEHAVAVLRRPGPDRRAATAESLYSIREALHGETVVASGVLGEVQAAMKAEARLVIVVFLLLSLLVLSVLWLLYRRVFRPLGVLQGLLVRLGEGRYAPADVARMDRLVQPLFENYNQMVGRLADLERLHREHAGSLEEQVRTATHALMQQQQSLARAERLAAVGELSAQVAHELRNPLAGIEMALANLRRESSDADVGERLDLVIGEMQRIARLLNDLLSRSRHAPEQRRAVEVRPVLEGLAQLVRYQVPPQIRIAVETEGDPVAELPPDGLRQAVLNLVLNAVDAAGDAPANIILRSRMTDGGLVIEVLDDGPGFAQEFLKGGVRRFVTGSEHGTGLGLSIAQRFARDGNGELRLSNRPGRGACAQIVLPVAADIVRD